MTELDRAYYEANRQKMIEATKRWQKKHPDALKSYQLTYQMTHKDVKKIYNSYYRLFGRKKKGMTAEDMQNAVKDFVDKQKL